MPIQFFDKETSFVSAPTEMLNFKGKTASALKATSRLIPGSDDITGIEIRLLPPYIVDNQTEPFLFFPGYASLYCLTIVVSDVQNKLAGNIDLQGFPRIGDEEHLPINKSIFYWQQEKNDETAPSQIHTMVSVIKSKKGLRNTGKILAALQKDENYKGIVKTVGSFLKEGTPAGAALDIITQLSGIVGKYLTEVEDKPVGTTINSFTSLYGDFNTVGVTKRHFPTKKVNFEMDIVVRDKSLTPTKFGIAKAKNQKIPDFEVPEIDMLQLF